ncbi:hypothetical protein B7C62_15570 [Kitasatospora albolonga]|uniref:Uncharacterized protein n=1 Tax=Kitasatospora albolonga TaxID=68173 RepID=A0ABC8BTC0_9ACTN|nr:hypothetical protein B7C62_15570 [Kitasatospora albolonga]
MKNDTFAGKLMRPLPVAQEVGPEYFGDADRDDAVAAGVRLVNGLRKFDIEFDGIGVSPVCDDCTVIGDPYVIELGHLRPGEALAMASKLDEYAAAFQRLREEIKTLTRADPEEKQKQKREQEGEGSPSAD